MKLLILSQYFHPETGAPQNRLLELAKIFRANKWEVNVITALPNYPVGKIFKGYSDKLVTEETIEGINVKRFWLYASNSSKSIPRIFSMITFSIASLFGIFSLRRFRPDYIFVESPPLLLGVSAYILSKFCSAKLIMNISDIWPLTAKELGVINDGFIYRRLEALEKFLYRNSFLNTGQSEEIIAHIRRAGGKNVYLFRNGVDVLRFEKCESKKNAGSNLKIIYAGLLGVAQGLFEIVRKINFSELKSELHIYGDGPEKLQLKKFIEDNGVRNVFLNSAVPREKIPELLADFDAALIPLTGRIFGAVPSKIYEAMAAGLPILFSGDGEGADLIVKSRTGVVSAPGNFESLKNNIVLIGSDPELRKQMSANGRLAAEKNFDRNKIIKNFSDKLVELNS